MTDEQHNELNRRLAHLERENLAKFRQLSELFNRMAAHEERANIATAEIAKLRDGIPANRRERARRGM